MAIHALFLLLLRDIISDALQTVQYFLTNIAFSLFSLAFSPGIG